MSDRFYSAEPITAERVTLDGPEAHHMLHVMRANPGDTVTLFDGSGFEFQAVVADLRRSEVELRVVARQEIYREAPFPLALGVSLPKGDRQKWLVEKCTELGVSYLVPLVTERSVAQPAAAALDRLRRTVVEASKQCGRNYLMVIAEPQTWQEWLNDDWPSQDPREWVPVCRLVAHCVGPKLGDVVRKQPDYARIAVGPEGGFTDAEIAPATDAGWEKVSLGPRILRVETAAIALAAAIALR